MKALTLTNQDMAYLNVFFGQTNGQTDGPKTICPDLSKRGHNNFVHTILRVNPVALVCFRMKNNIPMFDFVAIALINSQVKTFVSLKHFR